MQPALRPSACEAAIPRYPTIDALRGLAVLGIALMNMTAFASPFVAYSNPVALGNPSSADLAAWALTALLVDGKMRAIFSMLFGASLLLMAERTAAAGDSPLRRHVARMGWLAVFGLAHAWLIWAGDILLLYAIVGLAAFAFRRVAVTGLLVAALIALVVQAGLALLALDSVAALADAAARPGAGTAVRDAWATVNDAVGRPDAAALGREVALHRGPYLALVADRIEGHGAGLLEALLLHGPETLGLMLLGMAALRAGALTDGWSRPRLLRVAAIAYALGLPAMAAIMTVQWARGFDAVGTLAATYLLALAPRWLIAIGHAAVALAWLQGPPGPLHQRVADVGRMALSNYLATSIVMTAIFNGLDLYGALPRWQLLLFISPLWAAILLWSSPMIARYGHGPIELLWRRLTVMSIKTIASPSQ